MNKSEITIPNHLLNYFTKYLAFTDNLLDFFIDKLDNQCIKIINNGINDTA